MATLGNITVTLKLPQHFEKLPESVQLALVDKLHWQTEYESVQVSAVVGDRLAKIVRASDYRRQRTN